MLNALKDQKLKMSQYLERKDLLIRKATNENIRDLILKFTLPECEARLLLCRGKGKWGGGGLGLLSQAAEFL